MCILARAQMLTQCFRAAIDKDANVFKQVIDATIAAQHATDVEDGERFRQLSLLHQRAATELPLRLRVPLRGARPPGFGIV